MYVFCHKLEVPPLHPVEVVIGWVAELGRVARHAVHQGRELDEGVDKHGREAEQKGEVEGGGDLLGPMPWHCLEPPVQDDSGEEGGEVKGGEVVMEVEDAEHEEERHVVDGPEGEHHGGRLDVAHTRGGSGVEILKGWSSNTICRGYGAL